LFSISVKLGKEESTWTSKNVRTFGPRRRMRHGDGPDSAGGPYVEGGKTWQYVVIVIGIIAAGFVVWQMMKS